MSTQPTSSAGTGETVSDWEIWNPLDPALAENPYPYYRSLREIDPVYLEPAFGWWFVTGHEEATKVLREPDGEMRFVWFQEQRMGRDVTGEPYCKGLKDFLPAVPGDDHRRIRATFKKHFTPARVRALREETEARAHALIDAMRPAGSADLCGAFASPLPMSTISGLLAIGEDERPSIAVNIKYFKLAIQFPPMNDEDLARANTGIGALTAQFADICARRRDNLGEDLLSVLVREADAGALTEDELVANAWGLFAGGYDTTAASISGGIVRLLESPEQLAALRDDPSLIEGAVDEILRFTGPAQAQHRIFDHEIELGGHTIPANTPIIVYLVGASHDGRWVENPDSLDVARCPAPKDHLAFGGGAHKCPGRHLARMTTEVALTALIDRLEGLRFDGPVEWDTENMPSGTPKRVPIAWEV